MPLGQVYVLAIVLASIVVGPFNALARVIVGAWWVAEFLWLSGMSEPVANMIGHGAVVLVGSRRLNGPLSISAWGLSIFMFLASAIWLVGKIDPGAAWTMIIWMAFAQLALVTLSTDKQTASEVLKVWREAAEREFKRMALLVASIRRACL